MQQDGFDIYAEWGLRVEIPGPGVGILESAFEEMRNRQKKRLLGNMKRCA